MAFFKRIFVKEHCRTPPSNRGIGIIGHEQARAAEVARNYRRGETWYKGMDSDQWDTKAMTDNTLTKRENIKIKKDFWKNFR